jgi:hypothetical protein
MKEELMGPKVEGLHFVAVPEINEEGGTQYYVYMLSLREDIMEGIIINSKGYGKNPDSGEDVKTSTLRHCIEVLLPNECAKIEPIMDELFHLSNEYWVSFWAEDIMYDKKFVFPPHSINSQKLIHIPELNKKGIII